MLDLTPSAIKLTPTGVKINTNLVWSSHNTKGVKFNTGVFVVHWPNTSLVCTHLYVFFTLNSNIAMTSGVASPLCQEGPSEKKNLPDFCLFFLIFFFFPICSLISQFFPLFPDFWQIFRHRGALCPPVGYATGSDNLNFNNFEKRY